MVDAIVGVVSNPLSSDIAGDDVDQVVKIDAVDLNAETSEFGKVQHALGRWFATDDGSSSPQFRFAQLSIVLAAFAHLFDYGVEGDAKFVGRELHDFSSGSQTLMWVSMFGASVAFLCLLPILSSVQRALKTGGELDQLGAGTVGFLVGGIVRDLGDLVAHERHQFRRLPVAGAGVDAEQAAVGVTRQERIDGVD